MLVFCNHRDFRGVLMQRGVHLPALSRRRLAAGAVSAVCLCLLVGCGIKTRTRSWLGQTMRIEIRIAEKANDNNPVAVDFLLVYDKKLLETLLGMSAADWFAKRDQIRRDFPTGRGFDRWGAEWIPGQRVEAHALPLRTKAKAAVIFANYFAPGEHRARLDPTKDVILYLDEKGIRITPLSRGERSQYRP